MPPRSRSRARRILRIALYAVLAVVVLLGGAAAYLYRQLVRRNSGPPPPVCAAAPLARRTFSVPVQLTDRTSPGRYQCEPTAAVTTNGDLAIAFQGRGSLFSLGALGLATVTADGRVTVGQLATGRKQSFDPWMTAASDGRLHLVWLGHDGGMPDKRVQIGYATSTDGRTWSAPRNIEDTAHDCPNELPGCMDKPMIIAASANAGAPDGRHPPDTLHAFYYSEPTEGLRAIRSTDGGARFGASAPAGTGAYGDVAITPRGRLFITYFANYEALTDRYGDPHGRIELASSSDGVTFSKPVVVSAPGEVVPFYFSNPAVAVDESRGVVYVAYPAGPERRWDIQLAASRDEGRTWTRVRVNDDAPCANHMTPRMVLDPRTGAVHLTWLENRTGHGALAYAACEPGGARCGRNEQVSQAPFAAYRFSRHLPDWLGDYGALVIDPARRHLHAVWAQPVDDDGTPTSRLFYARATLAD